MFLNIILGVDASQKQVRDAPLTSFEAVSLVDKRGCEAMPAAFPTEYCLPPIAVAGPPINDQDSSEIREIRDSSKESLG